MRPSCQFQYPPCRPNGCGGAANCIVTHGRATDAFNTARGTKTDKEQVYARETRADADTAKVLTMDEARRVVANIAKLPTLLPRK